MINYFQSNSLSGMNFKKGDAVLIWINENDILQDDLMYLAERQPAFVAFAGRQSEYFHDSFDHILNKKGIEVTTTWHCNEDVKEIIWEFLNIHFPLSGKSGNACIVEIGSGKIISDIMKQLDLKNEEGERNDL